MHTLTITTDDGRTWSSILQGAEISALVSEAHRIAEAEGQPVTPADVAATMIMHALAGLRWQSAERA